MFAMARDASTQVGYADAVVDAVLDVMFADRSGRSHAPRKPRLAGLSGLQGSGKSRLAQQLAALANARGVPAVVLSLDDFYCGRRERARLAREVHPLLATRGVPGTHDIELLARTLAGLARANVRSPVLIPRFDKGADTRLPPSRWRRLTTAPRLILLEGWCVGIPAQFRGALARAINPLERDEDSDGRWRRWVNARLAAAYVPLWRRLDTLITLEAPTFAIVSHWREEQERALWQRRAPHAMDAAALARFLMHYERLSRHALRELPAHADLRIILRPDRSVRKLVRARGHDRRPLQRAGSTTTAVP
jgi:D-glycerate 3-kinase